MLASLAIASALLLGSGESQSTLATPAECEVLSALLAVGWPPEPPGEISTFYLDPWGIDRDILSVFEVDQDLDIEDQVISLFSRGDHLPREVNLADHLLELFPQLDRPAAEELAGYFTTGPSYRVACNFPDLPLTPASSSLRENLFSQDRLQYPRIAVSQPLITADGRYALGGYEWSFFPGGGFSDHCLFERVEDGWRAIGCVLHG